MRAVLLLGDAITLLPMTVNVAPQPALVLTDPPFSISNQRNAVNHFNGYTSNKGEWDACVDVVWVEKSYAALKSSGAFACFGVFGSLVPVFLMLEQLDATFQSHPIYEKSNPAPSIHRRMYTHANEIVLVYSKGSNWTFNYDAAKQLAAGKQLKNVWKAPVAKRILGRTIKHPSILDNLLLPLSNPGDWVLDPFCGTCSIGLHAVQQGRNFIGIEKYAEPLDYGIEQFRKLGIEPEVYEFEQQSVRQED